MIISDRSSLVTDRNCAFLLFLELSKRLSQPHLFALFTIWIVCDQHKLTSKNSLVIATFLRSESYQIDIFMRTMRTFLCVKVTAAVQIQETRQSLP